MNSAQLWFTTKDIEEMVFWGETSPPVPEQQGRVTVPAGTYRVVAGELYRVLPGVPPSLNTPETP